MIVGLGIDAVEIERVEKMLDQWRERLLTRLLTPVEVAYLAGKARPAQHLAVRLAAKEAAYKALSGNDLARGISWQDIEVFSRADGSPELRLHGRAASRFQELQATAVHVSLSHSHATAVAVVIVER
jgi:holo-[acyl-carrier protein] synthase